MKKLHRGGSNPDGEPLSAGRVEYLEAARQRVHRRRLRRTVIILAVLILVTLFATGAVGTSIARVKDLWIRCTLPCPRRWAGRNRPALGS